MVLWAAVLLRQLHCRSEPLTNGVRTEDAEFTEEKLRGSLRAPREILGIQGQWNCADNGVPKWSLGTRENALQKRGVVLEVKDAGTVEGDLF